MQPQYHLNSIRSPNLNDNGLDRVKPRFPKKGLGLSHSKKAIAQVGVWIAIVLVMLIILRLFWYAPKADQRKLDNDYSNQLKIKEICHSYGMVSEFEHIRGTFNNRDEYNQLMKDWTFVMYPNLNAGIIFRCYNEITREVKQFETT